MNILLIEDDVSWQSKILVILEKIGYQKNFIAANFLEAKTIISTNKIDFIICDIILEHNIIFNNVIDIEINNLPIIFISMHQNNYLQPKAKYFLFHTFLKKPINIITLESNINNLLLLKENYNFSANEKRVVSKQINEVFDIFKSTKLLEYLKIGERESEIMYERLVNNKTFAKIGLEKNMTDENVRQLYLQGIRRLKPKIKSGITRFIFFVEKTKDVKNKISLAKHTTDNNLGIDKNNIAIEEYLKCSIDDLELLGTKWKNVLHEKGVHRMEQILELTKRQLLLYPHFGNYSISLIELELSHKGLKLKKG